MFEQLTYYDFHITGDAQALTQSFDFLTGYKATIEEDEESECCDDETPTIDWKNGIVRFSFGTPDDLITRIGFDSFIKLTALNPSLRVMIQEFNVTDYESALFSIENGEEQHISSWRACLEMNQALLAIDLKKRPTPTIIAKTITLVAGIIKDSIDYEDSGFDYENNILVANVFSEWLLNALTPALIINESVASELRNLAPRIDQLKELMEKLDLENEPFDGIDQLDAICEAADLDFVASNSIIEKGLGKEQTLRI